MQIAFATGYSSLAHSLPFGVRALELRLSIMVDPFETALAKLATALPCGYLPNAAPATEPTALAALALASRGRTAEARPALKWLAQLQAADGSIGMSQTDATPCWPTALAVLAWASDPSWFRRPIERATAWILNARGESQPRSQQMGHDSTLVGWPWVASTHSWIEPTAWCVLALKSCGHADHPRTREAVRLLLDRLLPSGGCNYGNTSVLGQLLRPHLQPTGLALMALAGERSDPRLARSVEYVQRSVSDRTSTASLCYGLLGLVAQGQSSPNADDSLAAAAARTQARNPADWRLALVALAALGDRSPLLNHAFSSR